MPSNPVYLLDNGTDLSSSVDWKSIDAIQILTKEVGTFTFNIRQGVGQTNPAKTIPSIGDTIELFDSSGIIWGGTVTEREPIISGLMITWQITATDWGFAMDGTLVKKNYAGVDPSVIAMDIITTFCAGTGINAATVADGGHVQVGNFQVPTIQFNYQQPSKALQSLATLIGWDWFIDPQKNLWFFLGDVDDGLGGGAVGDGGKAPITIDGTSGGVMWNTLDIDCNITNMQNSVYVIGGTYLKIFTASNTPDSYMTDGVQQTFPTSYSYDESELVVTLNGVPQTIGILNQVTDPLTVDVLYDSADRNVQFTAGAPSSGQTVLIYGYAQVPIVANATNAASIAVYGVREGVIVDSKITSVPEALLRAQAQIGQFGHPVFDLKVTTLVPGCRIGQTITANVPSMGITDYPLVIKRVEATVSGSFTYAYEKTVDGVPSEQGTTIEALGYAAQSAGSCLLDLFPNDGAELLPDGEPNNGTPTLFSVATPTAIQDALARAGFLKLYLTDISWTGLQAAVAKYGAVIVEAQVGSEWWTSPTGAESWAAADVLPVRPPTVIDDSHFFVLGGEYNETQTFFANSWSTEWGQNGFGYFGQDYVPFIKNAIVFYKMPPSVQDVVNHPSLTQPEKNSLIQAIINDIEQEVTLITQEIGTL